MGRYMEWKFRYGLLALALAPLGFGLASLAAVTVAPRVEASREAGGLISSIGSARPELLTFLVLEYDGIASSLLWVSCIFSFSDQLVTRSTNLSGPMGNQLKAVVELDPYWKYPHEFAGLVLEGPNGGPDSIGLEILSKGIQRFPKDGRLTLIYSQLVLKASWMDSATRLDSARVILLPLTRGDVEAPEFARTLAITMTARKEGPQTAVRQLIYLWYTESSPLIRQSFANKLPTLLRDAYSIDGDSLKHVVLGIQTILMSSDPKVYETLDHLIQQLGVPKERHSAYAVLREMGRIAN